MQLKTKTLIRLRGCAASSAPLLFAYGINRFAHDVVQLVVQATTVESLAHQRIIIERTQTNNQHYHAYNRKMRNQQKQRHWSRGNNSNLVRFAKDRKRSGVYPLKYVHISQKRMINDTLSYTVWNNSNTTTKIPPHKLRLLGFEILNLFKNRYVGGILKHSSIGFLGESILPFPAISFGDGSTWL